MRILALDLGTTTGWAANIGILASANIGILASGSVSMRPSRYDGGGMRYLRFREWLRHIYGEMTPIDVVYYEEVRRHMGVDAAHVYGGLLAVLTSWCEERAVPYQGVPVGTIKKHATGKGNASKAEMIAAARKYAPHASIDMDDNEADAICILHWAIETGGGVA